MLTVNKISETGQSNKDKIDHYKSEIAYLECKLRDLVSCCDHELRELTESELKDEWMSVGSRCLICGSRFGWRCKNSSDSVCHYHSDNGKVEMVDGTKVDVPYGHDENNETDDRCIFCGMPAERK